MADFGLPSDASISDVKRNGIPGLRRTTIHSSTSQSSYGSGELVYIPIDTGTAGSFFDCRTAHLDMTVEIYNRNYFVDMINLPRCGFHALIEQMGVEIHNSLHDDNRFHAECIEAHMIRNGINPKPYECIVSNPYVVGGGMAGENHINLIKPSMVTHAGLPHGVQYAVLTQPSGSNVSSSVSNVLTEGMLLNGHPYLKKPMGRNGFGTITQYGVDNGSSADTLTGGYIGRQQPNSTSLNNEFAFFAETTLPCSSVTDDRISRKNIITYTTAQGTTSGSGVFGATVTGTPTTQTWAAKPTDILTDEGGTSYNHDTQILSTNRYYGTYNYGGRYSKIVPRYDAFGWTQSDNSIFDVHYGQTVGGYTPMMWPAKQPCDMEKLSQIRKSMMEGISTKNISQYYANCKNIGVAIPINLSNNSYGKDIIWGEDSELPLPTYANSKGHITRFRVRLKFYSCLFGEYQKKWFPSLLIGAGRVRIRLRLQQPNIAFQTLMDPCRKMPHTARDVFPFLGLIKCGAHYSTGTTVGLNSLSNGVITSVCHGVHPILISDYVAGSCFNDLVAIGKFPVPQQRMKFTNKPLDLFCIRGRRLVDDTVISELTTRTEDTYGGIFRTTGGSNIDKNIFNYVSLAAPGDSSTDILITDAKSKHLPAVVANAYLAQGDGTTDSETEFRDRLLAENQRFQGILTMMRDMMHEITSNAYIGYPSNPLLSGSTQTHLDSNFNNPGYANLNFKSGQTQITSDPIFHFQNYHFNTDFASFFTDRGRQAALDPYVGTQNMNYVAGDIGTQQAIWHPRQSGSTQMAPDYLAGALNWEIYNRPLPQYVPFAKSWDKRATRTFNEDDFLNEEDVCFGTYLERSVAQVRRTNKNLFSLGADSTYYPGVTERLDYRVTDISFGVEEIILPESASLQIVASAMEGGITMETDVTKSIEQVLQKQDNLKVLLNVSAGIVNDICFLFQPTEILQGDKAYGYNSFAFYNPYTSFRFIKQNTGTTDSHGGGTENGVNQIPPTPDTYNYLGGDPQYYNALSTDPHLGINTYLSISTEYFPRIPIDDIHTLVDHISWGDQHIRGNTEYLGLNPIFQQTYDASNYQSIVPFQDGFFSVFTPIECLDDQTITDNPYFTTVELGVKKLIRGKRAKNPALPIYKPYDGTFHLSFNLQAFMGNQDRLNVGTPMINNNSYLLMQNAHLLREFDTRMLTIIRCFGRIVIERGGVVQIFT